MGRQRIKVQVSPITGEEREATGSQDLSQGVDHPMSHVLCARTELKHRKNLGTRVDGQPEPQHLFGTAQPGAQFVHLQVREVQIAEEAVTQGMSMLTCTSQPGGDGRLPIAEDPFGSGSVQSFGQRRQYHCDVMRRGFQTVEGGVEPGREGGAAGLTPKRLDRFSAAMLAIANQRVNLIIGDPAVPALWIGTSETFGVSAFGGSSAAFDLAPGLHRRRRWLHARRGRGGESTGGAIVWAAGREQTVEPGTYLGSCSRLGRTRMGPAQGTKQREKEQEEEQEHLLVHKESSWFEMRRRDNLLLRRKHTERREEKSSG